MGRGLDDHRILCLGQGESGSSLPRRRLELVSPLTFFVIPLAGRCSSSRQGLRLVLGRCFLHDLVEEGPGLRRSVSHLRFFLFLLSRFEPTLLITINSFAATTLLLTPCEPSWPDDRESRLLEAEPS